jgi:MATE family multidrug resistance protein
MDDLASAIITVENAPVIDTNNTPVPFTKDTWLRKTKEIFSIAWQVGLSYVVYTLLGFIMLTFVGRLGEVQGAAAGLANFYIAVTGIAFCTGILGAEETLCSQAFGAGNMQRVSIVFQRSAVIMVTISIPMGVIWCFTTPLLIALKQDPEVARLAGHFVLIFLPSLPFYLVNDALRRYLICQNLSFPTLMSNAIANSLCIVLGYILILHTPLGFYGMPITMALDNVLQLAILIVWTIKKDLHKPTWRRITKAELLDWRENILFMKLGVPGALMLCAEWIGFEIHGLMAGWIGISSLAAQAIMINTNYLFFSIPLGTGIASTVISGNEFGSGHYQEARLTYKSSILDIEILAVCTSIFLFSFSSIWGKIFTNAPEVVALVSKTLPMMAVFVCSDWGSAIGGGVIRGAGQQSKAAVVNLVAFYCVGVPLGYLLAFNRGWGLIGLWTGLAAASYTACFALHGILIFGDWRKWAEKAKERAQADHASDQQRTEPAELSGDQPVPLDSHPSHSPSDLASSDAPSLQEETHVKLDL